MDRVLTLSNKLKEQLDQNASIEQLLVTVEMLQSELMHKKQLQPKKESSNAVTVNIAHIASGRDKPNESASKVPEEKTVEVLQVDEAELEAELEEIKRIAQAKNNMGVQNKPALLFDPVEDIPTLIHQQPSERPLPKPDFVKPAEVHESISKEQTASLNEKLKQTKIELGDTLVELPVKDLKKAIGINDRFLFIRELFANDSNAFDQAIEDLDLCQTIEQAVSYLKKNFKWTKNEASQKFLILVKRRFSN